MFTANESLIVKRVAMLQSEAFRNVLLAAIKALTNNLPAQPAPQS